MQTLNEEILPIFETLGTELLTDVQRDSLASIVVSHFLCLVLVRLNILIHKLLLEKFFQSLLFLKVPAPWVFLNFGKHLRVNRLHFLALRNLSNL